MFAQHMLAVCKPNGLVTTVMPNGVLFRGGAEKDIRRKFLEQDLIEAIIGLPTNLFYGASIPACIMVMRPNLTGQKQNPNKPQDRRGRILFINADAEFYAGRAQNYLLPEHIEKIVSTYNRFENVDGYARLVSIEEIGSDANDWSLNIRRYVDNLPSPEPHDVHAHMLGGVPAREVESKQLLFESIGFDPGRSFVRRDGNECYLDFARDLVNYGTIATVVREDAGVNARSCSSGEALAQWWKTHATHLADLPIGRDLNSVRSEFLDSFVAALNPLGILNHSKLAGVIAAWWTETLPDFKTLLENGFPGVIDGWIDAITDALEDDDAASPIFDPLNHKLVRRTMSDYLERMAVAKMEVARLKSEKEAFEQSNPPDGADEEELDDWNYAKELARRTKALKAEQKEDLKELKRLQKVAAKIHATSEDRHRALAAQTALQPVLDQLASIEALLVPYEQIKNSLAAARALFGQLAGAFVDELKSRCNAMNDEQKRVLVLELFAQDVREGLDTSIREKQLELVQFIQGIWSKYRVTLTDLRKQKGEIETTFNKLLEVMRYA